MGINQKYKLELRLKVAQSYESTGDNLHAIQLYHSLIQEEPDFIEAYFSLSELYEKLNNIESAKKLLKGYLENNPDNNIVRLYFGQLLIRHSQWNEVIDILHNVLIEEEPLSAFFLGYSYFMLKDFEPAKINFLNFIEHGKKTELLYEAYIYIAKTEIQLKNFKNALEYAKKAEVVYANFWELNLIYSIIYYNLGMFAHAIAPVKKAIKLNPEEASSYEWAGRIYLKTGDYIKSEQYFLKHIQEVENPSPDVYFSLAEACLGRKKAKEALQYYEMALKIDPQNVFALEGKKNAASLLEKQASDG